MWNPLRVLVLLVLFLVAVGLAWYIIRPGPTIVTGRAGDDAALATNRLKQIAGGVLMYATDYQNHLPPMDDAATLQEHVRPYPCLLYTSRCV